MLLIAPVSSVIEVAAKLHCLIVTHDPDLKLEEAPWPELRTLLKDLIRINGARDDQYRHERLPTRSEPARSFTLRGRSSNMDLGKSTGVRDVLNLATQYKAAAVKLGENPSGPNHLPQRLLALLPSSFISMLFFRREASMTSRSTTSNMTLASRPEERGPQDLSCASARWRADSTGRRNTIDHIRFE